MSAAPVAGRGALREEDGEEKSDANRSDFSPSLSLSSHSPRGGAQPCTHGMVARVREHRTAGQDLTRGEGRQSARLFANGTDLEPILIGRNYQLRDTVLRK